MTIKELKEQLAGIPDEAKIVVPGNDHTYRLAVVDLTTALFDGRWWNEDFGEDTTPESEYGKRLPVLLIS